MLYSLDQIERTRQHVLQAESLVVHQIDLVERLRRRGLINLATQAESVLDTLLASFVLARDDLVQLDGCDHPSFLDIVARRLACGSRKVA